LTSRPSLGFGCWVRRPIPGRLLLENNAPAGFHKCLGRSEDRCSQQWCINGLSWIRGPGCGGRSPWRRAGALLPDKPISGGWHDENQRLADVQRSVQTAEAGCVRSAEAESVTFGGQPRVWTSPKRGPWTTPKRSPVGFSGEKPVAASRGGRVSTWVDDRGAT